MPVTSPDLLVIGDTYFYTDGVAVPLLGFEENLHPMPLFECALYPGRCLEHSISLVYKIPQLLPWRKGGRTLTLK